MYGQLDDLPSPGVEPRPPLGCQTLTPVTAWWAARKRYRSLSVTPTYARTTVIVHPRVPDEHNSWAAPAMLFDLLGIVAGDLAVWPIRWPGRTRRSRQVASDTSLGPERPLFGLVGAVTSGHARIGKHAASMNTASQIGPGVIP